MEEDASMLDDGVSPEQLAAALDALEGSDDGLDSLVVELYDVVVALICTICQLRSRLRVFSPDTGSSR